MSIEGVDFSFGRPGGKALAAAGKSFVVRYLSYRGAAGGTEHKFLTAPELADYRAHGLAVCANLESSANRALDGRAAGVMDGADALADMRSLGFPDSCPVYFSVDFDPQPQYLARIDAYFAGVAVSLPLARIGVYGGYNLLGHLRAKGLAVWFWMAAGWDGGHQPPTFAHLWQYQTGGMGAKPINGAAVDLDRALKTNYGQFDPPPGAGPASPEPTTVIYDFTQDTTKPVGSCTVKTDNPDYSYISLGNGVTTRAPGVHYSRAVPGKLVPPLPGIGDRSSAYLVGPASHLTAVLASDVVFTPDPTPDCSAAVAAAVAPLTTRIAAAQKALGG